MNIKELRQKAKEAGIKSWHVKGAEKLQKELAELTGEKILLGDIYYTPDNYKNPEPVLTVEKLNEAKKALDSQDISKPVELKPEAPKIEVLISKQDLEYIKSVGFKAEWLESLANQYNFTKFVYMPKFKAFRCYLKGIHVDWISINDFGIMHLKQEQIAPTKLTFQPLSTARQVIKLPWRKIKQIKINDPSMR